MEDTTNEVPDKELVTQLRQEVKAVADKILDYSKYAKAKPRLGGVREQELQGEEIANAILAFRHAEDAAMRLGKVLQALNDGTSVYDDGGVPKQS